MKKYIAIIFLMYFCSWGAKAQTFQEWFKQDKTKKEYLIKQIAALKTFMSNLRNGYAIAQRGLYTIENIKNGNFNLHRDFFYAMKNVNPHIKNSAKVADIVAFQFYIIRDFKRMYQQCQQDKNFTPDELYYLSRVYTNLMKACDISLAHLITMITPDKIQLSDDERLNSIDLIYDDMSDKYQFVQAFANDTRVLSTQRTREKIQTEILKKNHQLI